MATTNSLGRIFAVAALITLAAMIDSVQGAISAVTHGNFGGSTSAPGATVTQPISVGAAADMLIVGTSSELGSLTGDPMSVTYGGVAMNLATGNLNHSAVWYLDLSTPGISGTNVVVNMSGYSTRNGFAAGWVTIDGGTDRIALHNTAAAGEGNSSVGLVTTINGAFALVTFNGNGTTSPVTVNSPTSTVVYTDYNLGSARGAAAYTVETTAGPKTYQWTLTTGTLPGDYRRIDTAAFITAVPLTWEGGDGNWAATNWDYSSATIAWPGIGDVTFDTSNTVTVNQDVLVDSITFGAGSIDTINGSFNLDLDGSIDTGANAYATISAPIVTTAGFTKTGSGTLALSGIQTYTGTTTVSAGTLLVNGSITSPVTVTGNATLGGSGTIAGAVSVGTGATLSPGNSPGMLTVGELTLANGANELWEINGSAYDQTVVTSTLSPNTGNLTFSGVVNFTIEPLAGAYFTADQTFTLFTWDGTLSGFIPGAGNGVSNFSVTYGGDASKWITQGATFAQVGNMITLTGIEYIPEPSTMILAGLGLAGVCFRRRRERK